MVNESFKKDNSSTDSQYVMSSLEKEYLSLPKLDPRTDNPKEKERLWKENEGQGNLLVSQSQEEYFARMFGVAKKYLNEAYGIDDLNMAEAATLRFLLEEQIKRSFRESRDLKRNPELDIAPEYEAADLLILRRYGIDRRHFKIKTSKDHETYKEYIKRVREKFNLI